MVLKLSLSKVWNKKLKCDTITNVYKIWSLDQSRAMNLGGSIYGIKETLLGAPVSNMNTFKGATVKT